MKKLTLTLTTALLAIACIANAENTPNPTTAKQDFAEAVPAAENPQAPSKPLTYADFRMVKREIDFRFQMLKSVNPVALHWHMNIDRVNLLFKRFAHEDAEQYLANVKRNSEVVVPTKAELAVHRDTSSFPDPYIIGR